MKLTQTAVVAVRAMARLASEENGEAVRSRFYLAPYAGTTPNMMNVVLGRLARPKYDLLLSSMGPTGGYGLARPASEISLLEIVRACGTEELGSGPDFRMQAAGEVDDRIIALFEMCGKVRDGFLATVKLSDLIKEELKA